MMQQPFTGGLVDRAPKENALIIVENQYRFIIGASTVGTIIGIIFLPTFVALFSRGIIHLSKQGGSILLLIQKGFTLQYIRRGINHITTPSITYIKGVNFRNIPKRLFFINMVATAVYTIGVLSALYASLIAPERAASTIMASGLINGIATILLTVFVDPKISVMADDVVNEKGNYSDLKGISLMMIISRLLGTILAQFIFIPGAHYIAWISKYFT